MKTTIKNRELKELINNEVVVCSTDCVSISIDKSETTGVVIEASLNNDNEFHLEFWLNESDEADLTDEQVDYVFTLLSNSLSDLKATIYEYEQEDIYDYQNDAMNANSLNY